MVKARAKVKTISVTRTCQRLAVDAKSGTKVVHIKNQARTAAKSPPKT